MASIAVLVYPLHAFTARMTTTGAAAPAAAAAGRPFGTYVVAVGLPSAAVWAFAVWAQTRCVWALGPGLWFGLFCACVTLKITSFVATASAAARAPATMGQEHAKGVGGAEPAAAVPLSLTFGEYLFFVFLSPSLVCEVGTCYFLLFSFPLFFLFFSLSFCSSLFFFQSGGRLSRFG